MFKIFKFIVILSYLFLVSQSKQNIVSPPTYNIKLKFANYYERKKSYIQDPEVIESSFGKGPMNEIPDWKLY